MKAEPTVDVTAEPVEDKRTSLQWDHFADDQCKRRMTLDEWKRRRKFNDRRRVCVCLLLLGALVVWDLFGDRATIPTNPVPTASGFSLVCIGAWLLHRFQI